MKRKRKSSGMRERKEEHSSRKRKEEVDIVKWLRARRFNQT